MTRSRPLRRPRVKDAAIAFGLLLLLGDPLLTPYLGAPGVLWTALAVPLCAALAWRRVHPRTVWAFTTALSAVLLALPGGPGWGALAPPLVALATAVSRAPRRRGLTGLAVTEALLLTGVLWQPHRIETVLLTAALPVAAWALGDGARSRRRYAAAMAARGAADERSRAAAELHDSVAGQLADLVLQAGTARMLAESGSPPAAELLAALEEAGRRAAAELRRVPATAAAHPGLDRLPVLIDRLAPAGLTIRLAGFPGELPPAVDRAAYRVVQEGLTNVLRHSLARTVRVELHRSPAELVVTVRDAGPSRTPAGTSAGCGLAVLRERAAVHGGRLEAGPHPHGGYELKAHLPV